MVSSKDVAPPIFSARSPHFQRKPNVSTRHLIACIFIKAIPFHTNLGHISDLVKHGMPKEKKENWNEKKILSVTGKSFAIKMGHPLQWGETMN